MRKVFTLLFGIFFTLSLYASNKVVPAYLIGPYKSTPEVLKALKDNGYKIVSIYPIKDGGTNILFSDENLKKEAAKKNRGFIAVLRAYVNDKDKELRITNPQYFGKAFMQKEYDGDIFESEVKKLKKAFGNLKPSKDGLKSDELSSYHFMFGMPYYDDFITVAKGDANELLNKVKSYNGGSSYLFDIKLSDNSYLVGFNLDPDVSSFPKKIGMQNALVLPYTVLIEDGEAKILSAKYYLAISYPKLSLGQFMQISSTPGKIEDNIKKAFK